MKDYFDDEWERMRNDSYTEELDTTLSHLKHQLETHHIPESYPKELEEMESILYDISCIKAGFSKDVITRSWYTRNIGFSLVSYDWVRALINQYELDSRNVLEIMSGTGILAKAFQDLGVNCIATDNYSWSNENYFKEDNQWTFVENIDAIDAIQKYGRNVDFIIVSWAYMDDTCYRCLQAMRKVNPNCKMIFIGEDVGGCTADDNFFESAEIVAYRGDIKANDLYKQWFGVYDRIYIIK